MIRSLTKVGFALFIAGSFLAIGCDTGAGKGSTAPKDKMEVPQGKPSDPAAAPAPPPAPK